MKKVIMLASTLKCSIVIKDLASNRSLISFLRGKNLIDECSIYAVDLKIGEQKAMEIAFSDTLFSEAVTIKGNNTEVIVPSEYAAQFKEIVP